MLGYTALAAEWAAPLLLINCGGCVARVFYKLCFLYFLVTSLHCAATAIETQPVSPQDWTVTPGGEVGIDDEMLSKAIQGFPAPEVHGLHSLLVLRHGKLVFERYWSGFERETPHDMRSATKSITSLLTGVAIDKHLLINTSDSIFQYLPAKYSSFKAGKESITLRNLLTMSSGLECDDRVEDSPGNEEKMYRERDWVKFFLDLNISAQPGGPGHYCTAGVVVLGRIIAEASNQSIPDFSQKYLFGPMHIERQKWRSFDSGQQTDTGGHLFLRPLDMAKIGQLVLQKGEWEGVQLISRSWIDISTSSQGVVDKDHDYGFLWWRTKIPYENKEVEAVSAMGNGGQAIIIVPELDLVVVFTAGNYNSRKSAYPIPILKKFILPAVK